MNNVSEINTLANMKLEYTYSTGERVILSIGEETLGFEWIGGEMDGLKIADLKYRCMTARDGQFIINWHNPNMHSFVTLLIDLETRKLNGSAIIGYTDDAPAEIFHEAEITNVSALE